MLACREASLRVTEAVVAELFVCLFYFKLFEYTDVSESPPISPPNHRSRILKKNPHKIYEMHLEPHP